jgi:hypothetical protein
VLRFLAPREETAQESLELSKIHLEGKQKTDESGDQYLKHVTARPGVQIGIGRAWKQKAYESKSKTKLQ